MRGGAEDPARQISIRSGVPQEVPAYTVNKACASGIKSIALGFQEIAIGNLDCVLAGGTESMSRLPYYLDGARWGYRMGHQELVDGMVRDGFFCPMAKMLMGETAELLAEHYKISREEQDQFALCSQTRAVVAQSSGRFEAEIAPVTIDRKNGTTVFSRDEHLFLEATLEKMAKLAPVFLKTGTISTKILPGSRTEQLLWCSERKLRCAKQAETTGADYGGDFGQVVLGYGVGPVPAIRKLEAKHKLKLADFDLIELMKRSPRRCAGLRPRPAFRS
jgi:acetyl-CoA C-acetyltransferase